MKREVVLTDQDRLVLERARVAQREVARLFGCDHGARVLEFLEEHFQVHLPVFQGKAGGFDPLDAMRRDAYREVFLYIRRLIALGGQHNDDNEYDD